MNSIRLKVITIILAVLLLLFAALFVGARQVLMSSFAQLERENVIRDLQRVINSLEDEVGRIEQSASDYAYWDDTYSFASGEFPEYAVINFHPTSGGLSTLDLDFVVITGPDDSILFSSAIDHETGEPLPLADGIESYIQLAQTQLAREGVEDTARLSGLYLFGDQIALVATSRILSSEQVGPARGTLTLGRIYDGGRVTALSEQLKLDIELLPLLDSERLEQETLITPLSSELVAGSRTIDDVAGFPIGQITITEARDIYARGQQTIGIIAVILLFAGTLLSVVMYFALDRLVVTRIARLSQEVDTIELSGTTLQRVTLESDDEVTQLARNINTMLERLEHARRQLIAALEQARTATRLKSEFLSTMSHELRTPLNAIIGYSGIMLEGIGGELDDSAMRMVGNIYDSSRHLLSLVNDVLDISKIEAGHLEIVEAPYSPRRLLDQIAEQHSVLAARKGLHFELNIAPDVPDFLFGDHERIAQVVINLLSNAFKFTDKGKVLLTANCEAEQFKIAVQDTGIGIPPHALSYIFEEFRQHREGQGSAKAQGTGLGLAIVRKLALAMGGSVEVESVLGSGSTFTICLPLRTAKPTSTQEMAIAQ